MIHRIISLCLASLLISTLSKSQKTIPNVVNGKIDRITNFESKHVTARIIDVWLPDTYDGIKDFAVLYMHDGQMLYDPSKSWNKQAWDVDDVASELILTKQVREFIVVGIWNGGKTRHLDYFPQKPFEQLSQIEKDTVQAQLRKAGRTADMFQPKSDNYLKFIVEELKPFIDQKYSVQANQENTFIAGSSMGGLISLYGICEYPEIFGGAACLSTHWIGTFTLENNPVPDAFQDYLRQNLPSPKSHKIYFDCGDQTLDAFYPEIQRNVDSIMKEKAYESKNWHTRYFPGENHSKDAWKKRLHIPLIFLLEN